MKNLLFFASVILFSANSFSQTLTFKVKGAPDTTVYLAKYYGKRLQYADTAEIVNGIVKFNGAKQKPGMLGLYLNKDKFFEFIYNNEEVSMETDYNDLLAKMKVKKSVENKILTDYQHFLDVQKKKANAIVEERKAFEEKSKKFDSLTEKINGISKEVYAYQNNLIDKNNGTLAAKIVKMSLEIEIPEPPKGSDGNEMTEKDAQYYRLYYSIHHYWDNFDLKDDRISKTPIFGQKFENYFSKYRMIQHHDTIIKYAFQFIDQLDPKSELFQYAVTEVILNFQKNQQMGMDKVYTYMVDKYFCTRDSAGKSPAYWMTEDRLESVCESIPGKMNSVLGVIPPNISLRDTTDVNWKDFYSLKSEYKVLYFWSPDCGHCKKVTPKLETLYTEKLKARNIEVFGVCKAMGDDFALWKKFIKDNHITYTNVAVTQSLYDAVTKDPRPFIPRYTTYDALNYHKTYDIFSTPRVFILDKNNEIIAKQLTISQLEDFLDKIQNMESSPKLFPHDPAEEKEESEIMKD